MVDYLRLPAFMSRKPSTALTALIASNIAGVGQPRWFVPQLVEFGEGGRAEALELGDGVEVVVVEGDVTP